MTAFQSLFRRKSLAALQVQEAQSGLHKTLNVWDLTAFGATRLKLDELVVGRCQLIVASCATLLTANELRHSATNNQQQATVQP